MKRLLKLALPLGIILIGLLGTIGLVASKPEVKTQRLEPVLPLVRVVVVEKQDVPLFVQAQGTVQPRTETTLAAQLAAQVIAVAPAFEVGGFFEQREVLVRLDSRDFELLIESAIARVAQARFRLTRELAESQVASREWHELGEGEADPLVLRKPQIAEAQAMLAAAEAQVAKARLDLERTLIRAPFAGRVRAKMAEIGQFVSPGQAVATVYATNYAEVRLPVPHNELAFLDLPGPYRGDQRLQRGPTVVLSATFAGQRRAWQGRIVRSEGDIDSRTRMLHLVAQIKDPYGQGSDPDQSALAMGLFVEAKITGQVAAAAVLLPRSALRGSSQVLIADAEERLRFRDVKIFRLLGESVVIAGGLEEGERVCVSQLDVAVDGMRVRTVEIDGPSPEGRPHSGSQQQPDLVLPSASAQLGHAALLLSAEVLRPEGRGLVVQIAVRGDVSYTTFQLEEPHRAVIDFSGIVSSEVRSTIEVGQGVVERIRISQHSLEPQAFSRIVFDLNAPGVPIIERTPTGVVVTFPQGL